MSLSDEIVDLAARCDGAGPHLPESAARELLSVAVRLYAARVDDAGHEFPPTHDAVSTTEAVVTAVALLRHQGLNAFDTALWFSRTARSLP